VPTRVFSVISGAQPFSARVSRPPFSSCFTTYVMHAYLQLSYKIDSLTCCPQMPIWFQAIKKIRHHVSTHGHQLRHLLSSRRPCRYWNRYQSVIFMSIGAGLLSTLQVDSGHAKWIGYQAIFGVGVDFGLQAAFSTAQTPLKLADARLELPL
jgi:hypothetical protein